MSLDPSQSATQKEEPPSSNHPPNRLTNQTLYLGFVARAELLYLSILSSSPTRPLFVVPDALLTLLFSSLFSHVKTKTRTQSSRAVPTYFHDRFHSCLIPRSSPTDSFIWLPKDRNRNPKARETQKNPVTRLALALPFWPLLAALSSPYNTNHLPPIPTTLHSLFSL